MVSLSWIRLLFSCRSWESRASVAQVPNEDEGKQDKIKDKARAGRGRVAALECGVCTPVTMSLSSALIE